MLVEGEAPRLMGAFSGPSRLVEGTERTYDNPSRRGTRPQLGSETRWGVAG